MDNRPSHDELRAELARRGLPRAYIDHFVAELDDHYTDLLEERNSRMGAARKLQFDTEDTNTDASAAAMERLGNPTQLAIFAAERYHARSFWGRHPWLTFALLPLPLLIASMVAFSVSLMMVGKALNFLCLNVLGMEARDPRDYIFLRGIVMGLVSWYFFVVPALASGLLLCRIYRRNDLNTRWPMLGCGLIALAMASATMSYHIPAMGETGTVIVGFSAVGSAHWILTWLPKFALAMGIGLLLIKRAQGQMEIET